MSKIYEALENAQRERWLRVLEGDEPGARPRAADSDAAAGGDRVDGAAQAASALDGAAAAPAEAAAPEARRADAGAVAALFEDAAAQLYRPIMAHLPEGRGLVALIGPHAGAGTSMIAREFAQFAATHAGHSALLLDADRSRPRQLAHFGMVRRATIGDAVAGERGLSEALHPVYNSGLTLATLTGGLPGTHVAFGSPRLRGVMQGLRERFDVIVADCAAFDRAPESAALCAEADAAVLVVQAGRSAAGQAARLRRHIETAGGSPIGVVVNFRGFALPRWIGRWFADEPA